MHLSWEETRTVDWHRAVFLANGNSLLVGRSLFPPPPPSTNLCRGILQLFSFQSHLWFHHLFPIFQPLSTIQSKHKTVSNTEPTPMKNINLCFHSNFKNFFQCSHKTTCKFSLALSYTLSTYILIIFHWLHSFNQPHHVNSGQLIWLFDELQNYYE